MLPQQIATADFLDILFENKNKSYGAYTLRKEYNKRLTTALYVTGAAVVALLSVYYLNSGANTISKATAAVVSPFELEKVEKQPEEKPVLPPPPPPPQRRIATRAFTPPVIVKEASPEEAPPAVEELENKKIGNITQEGDDDLNITAPPVSDNRGIIEAPVRDDEDENKIFVRVEIESSFPGGMNAWRRFLLKNFHYPQAAQENNIQGVVTVKFIVDKEGHVSNVEAVSGPEELRAEAVRVISTSGKWNPAVQNGRQVKSYKLQAVVFRLDQE